MKTMKSKLLALVLLLVGGIVMSFTLVNKGKSEAKTEVKEPTTWHYTSNSTEDGAFSNVDNWTEGEGNCGTFGNKPCDVEVPENMTLADIIAGKTNAEVLDINPASRRN